MHTCPPPSEVHVGFGAPIKTAPTTNPFCLATELSESSETSATFAVWLNPVFVVYLRCPNQHVRTADRRPYSMARSRKLGPSLRYRQREKSGWALLAIDDGVPRFVGGGTAPIVSDQNVISVPMQILHEVGVPLSVVGVELIRGKAHAEGNFKKAAAKSKHLAHASRISGACEMAAHSLGWPVESFPATEWRKALIGNPFASDKTIGAVLRLRVRGIPRSNCHVRDAIGVALYAYLRMRLLLRPCPQASVLG